MTLSPKPHKMIDGIASHEQMFRLLNDIPECSLEDRISGKAYENQWFEIERDSYDYMLEILPPLYMRAGAFALSELKAGSVASHFLEVEINGRIRWFHCYSDLRHPGRIEVLRTAICEQANADRADVARAAKLDLIWSRTHDDFRGIAGQANPDAWPAEHHGKRSILIYEPGVGTVCKLLEQLTDAEIDEKLPRTVST